MNDEDNANNELTNGSRTRLFKLQQEIHDALRVQHPDWIEPNGGCLTCESYESRLAELLGLSSSSESAGLHLFSAKGATITSSLGQSPRIPRVPENGSAESATHFRHELGEPLESHFQRLVGRVIRFLGRDAPG